MPVNMLRDFSSMESSTQTPSQEACIDYFVILQRLVSEVYYSLNIAEKSIKERNR